MAPLWRASLKGTDYKKQSWGDTYYQFNLPHPNYSNVSFVGTEFIAVAYPVYEGRNPPASRRFRAILFDSKTGKPHKTREWLALQRELGLLTPDGGNLVVRVRQKMIQFTSNLEQLAEFPLPDTRRPIWENWDVLATPSGRFLVTAHYLDRDLTLEWLNATTLEPSWSWKAESGWFGLNANRPSILTVSDDGIAAGFWQNDSHSCDYLARTRVGSWRTIWKTRKERTINCDIQWVREGVLFIPIDDRIAFLSADGRNLKTENLGKDEFALYGRSSLDGGRVAVPICRERGGVEVLDISSRVSLERIIIYDLPGFDGEYVLSRKNFNLSDVSGFALSPNGSMLVLIRGMTVELYELPVRSSR